MRTWREHARLSNGRSASGFDPVFEGSGTYGCAADFGVGLACGVGKGGCCGADAGLTGAAGGMVMSGKPTTSFDGGLAGAGGALGLGESGGLAVSVICFRPSPASQYVPAAAPPNTTITARTTIQAHLRRPFGSMLRCSRVMAQHKKMARGYEAPGQGSHRLEFSHP